MKVFWHGQCIQEYDSDEEWDNIDFDRHMAKIADTIISLDRSQVVKDLVDWFEAGYHRWFLERLFDEGFGDNTLEDFTEDAVASAFGIILDLDYEGTYFGLEVVE